MPGLVLLPAVVLAATFAVSGAGKLLDLGSAAVTLRALRIEHLPPRTVVVAVAVTEILTTLGLLLGAGPVVVTAALSALALSLLFLAVGLRAQARHSTDECGCFGRVASTRVGPWMTARNAALVVVSGVVVAGVFTAPTARPLLAFVIAQPVASAGVVLVGLALALIGASLRPTGSRPAADGSAPDAALMSPDGAVVVPRQRALRGRAQLLLFVRRGCSSCENLIDRMTWDRALLESLVDVRLIVAVGDGSALDDAGGLHADASGQFALALGIPGDRPAGVLLTTAGDLLLPIAVGGEETASLVDTVLAAAADARPTEGTSTN